MKHNKLIGIFLTAVALATIGAIGITSINSNFVNALSNRDVQSSYTLTLNSSNKVTSAGERIQHTALGNNVTFTYTNVGNPGDGHTRINIGGTVANTTQITSITSFKAVFSGSGTLKGRIAYVSGSWGEYFNIISNTLVEFASKPYFLELSASDSYVDLVSAVYTYSCTVNPDAAPQDTSGSYDITFLKNTDYNNDGSSELTTTSGGTFWDEVVSGDDYISSVSLNKVYWGRQGLKFGSSSNTGYLIINFDSTTVKNAISSIDFETTQYSNESGKFKVTLNGSSTAESTQITPANGGTIVFNTEKTLTSLKIETTTKRAYLSGISLNYGSSSQPVPDNPTAYETGFTATDSNKNDYTTNSIFDNENALVVQSIKSDGSTTILTSSQYTYRVYNSNDQQINTSANFSTEGTYTLVVSYGEYIPVEIALHVGPYISVVDIAASMTTTTFTTADTLANYLTSNIVANITYSNETSATDISYAEFATYELGVKLIRAGTTSYPITSPFGSAGMWSVRVYWIPDEANIYNDISITVNAIPVQSISLSESSYSLYPEDTLQLTATVGPNNATNKDIVWSSADNSIATVSESGLVTAIAVGGTTITATALDGSNVYGSCAITVVAKPATTDYDIDASVSTQVTTNSTSKVVFTNSPLTVTIEKNSSSTNANNYVATSSHTRAYTGQKFTISTGGASVSKIVIHGNNAKGVGGFTNATWTNATMTYSGLEVTLTPTNPTSNVYGIISATCSFSGVTVTCSGGNTPAATVYPTAISLTGTYSSISIGSTSQLTVNYTPSETNVKNITFTSSNENIATVSSTGLITGVAQGNATITATAQAASGTVSNTFNVIVTPISVTGVTLDNSSTSVKVGKTITLVATVSPSNATNKSVTWTSSNTAIATVSSAGVVTGVAAGSATITVKTVDGNKTATCTVTVTTSSGGEETFSITYTDLPTSYQTGSTVYTASSGIKFQAYNCANYSSKMQWKASSGYLQSTEGLELQSITINDRESNTLTVYGSNTAGSFATIIEGDDDVYDLTGYSYFKVARTSSGAAYCSSITVTTGTPTPTDPTSIILSPTTADVGIGGTKQLSVSYVPGNANQNKEVNWTSSNTSVATVSSSGLVSIKSTATAGQTATITARLTNLTSIYATCTITVVAKQQDDHTALIYICGADLESENHLATGDITEILKVSGQPDDVNIVIETGGASSWASTYGISSTKLERWHVENKSLVKDDSLTYASMGLASTLQSFIEYGLNNYPAERTGLVLWNHGGGMRGVCYDEKKNDDVLKSSEVKSAVSGALNNCGLAGQKLEWIGYDACLMAVQDIAETNSAYFKYMIASEESEAGYGWDYDTWVDDLYAKKTTPVILKAIVDGFISDNGGANSSSGDQTLSYLDLSYAAAYKNAWEAMAEQLYSKVTSSNRSNFNSAIINNVKHFADADYDYFCTFDAWDFIDKLANNSAFSLFRLDASYTNAIKTAFANLVAYSVAQKGAGVAKGLCMYWCNSTLYSDVREYYTTSETNFTNWRTLNVNRGYHA